MHELPAEAPAAPRERAPAPRLPDRLLTLAALLFGLATVFYPFGGDQGLYYYVGREWLAGSVPYRDAMEQKTPLVFLLHALLVFVTGQNMWAIRVAELAWVVVVGLAVADLASPAGEPRRPGARGLAALAVSLLYFGLFNYWDTAQCEIWYAGLSLFSLRAVVRRPAGPRSWWVAGLFGGLALLMKPPAAPLLALVVGVMLVRAVGASAPGAGRKAALGALAAFGAGASLPLALVALYFLGAGGLAHLVDLAFRANYHDMIHSSTVSGPSDVLRRIGDAASRMGPLAPSILVLTLLGTGSSLRRRRSLGENRYALGLLLLVAGCLAVVMQRKFYGYHWGALAPLMALPLVCLGVDLERTLARRPGSHPGLGPALVAMLLLAGFATTGPARDYARTASLTGQYLLGRIDRAAFLAPFALDHNTPYAQQEVVGRWIARHSSPTDEVAVRGFEQVVYAVARRRSPTRFFWTRWLTEPRRAYRREEWLAEDRNALERRPPRYVVVNLRAREGPASRAHFEALGYVERFRHERLTVLERRPTGT